MGEVNNDQGILVSLCMSTSLRADLFPESFAGILKQTYSPLEIIVLADGSDPGSVKILEACRDPRVRFITTPKSSGMVPAWNRVCREAKGKYMLFCADDDVLLENAIDQQIELMEKYPSVVFCHADWTDIDDDSKELNRHIFHRGRFIDPGLSAWPKYLIATQCCMQTTVMRRSAWEQVGGWDEDAGHPGDNSLYLKLLRIGDVGHVPKIACKYRVRTRIPDSWGKGFRDLRQYYALAMKHLSNPPAGIPVSLEVLRKRLMSYWARRAVSLGLYPPNQEDACELRNWMAGHVWPESLTGQTCQALDKAGALVLMEAANRVEYKLRQIVKPIVAIWYKTFTSI